MRSTFRLYHTASASITGLATSEFIPRSAFAIPKSLPNSYYLGHHAEALTRFKRLLPTIDLVLEVRDARLPATSANPLLARTFADKPRLVVYMKRDLAFTASRTRQEKEKSIKEWCNARGDVQSTADVVFFSTSRKDASRDAGIEKAAHRHPQVLLDTLARFARTRFKLTGTRILVAGMPNVGKSTLINTLRGAANVAWARSTGGDRGADVRRTSKVAQTGNHPGVTRSIGGTVKILEGWQVDGLKRPPDKTQAASPTQGSHQHDAQSEPVYLLDAPGVFVPYLPDGEAMLKLALCGCVKDGLIPPTILADYLLFHLNQVDPGLCTSVMPQDAQEPTNEVGTWLERIARRTGKLVKSGWDPDAVSTWVIGRWRRGDLGSLTLDPVERLEAMRESNSEGYGATSGALISVSQARRAEKERRRERGRAKALQS